MAERRMFAKTIVLSDSFLDMPMSSRCLYFTLGMLADDDGFVNSPKSIMRQCGATIDDMNVLISKKFILVMDGGVVVIKHWRIHNYIQSDRYVPTKYKELKDNLMLDENKAYTECIHDVSAVDTQDRLGKDRLGKDNTKHPSVEEVAVYIQEKGYHFGAEEFIAHYESNGWKVGKNPMKNWKAACVTWEKRRQEQKPSSNKFHNFDERSEGYGNEMDAFNKMMEGKCE